MAQSLEDGRPLPSAGAAELAVINSIRNADSQAVKSSLPDSDSAGKVKGEAIPNQWIAFCVRSLLAQQIINSNSAVAPLLAIAPSSVAEGAPVSPLSNALSLVRHTTHTDRGEACAESAPLIPTSRSVHCQTDSIGPVETLNLPD